MSIKVGDTLPSVDLYEGFPDKVVNTSEFLNSKVIIVGVPGAFTPTCSSTHVPSFLKSIDEIKKKGVEQIICTTVNDPFVTAAWGASLDPDKKIRFLADPRAEFCQALGLSIDLTSKLGSVRSQRYFLVAENGKVKAINVEPDGTGLTCSRGTDVLKLL